MVMNKASAKRLMSKQEASVLLGELDLCSCTETIESVSITNSKVLRGSEEKEVNKSIVTNYKNRPARFEKLSLYDYFHLTKGKSHSTAKTVIPHFVGVSGTPKYPVTETCARHVLTVYRPWRDFPDAHNTDLIVEFNDFINRAECPPSAKMHYNRAMLRYFNRTTSYEPKNHDCDHSMNPMSVDDKALLDLVGLKKSDDVECDSSLIKSLPRGCGYQWDSPPKVRGLLGMDAASYQTIGVSHFIANEP